MRLGDFLTSAKPAPVKPVSFRVIGLSQKDGSPLIAEAQATLVFVNDEDREDAIKDAGIRLRERYCVKDEDGSIVEQLPIPEQSRIEEELYQLIHRALRESEDLSETFASSVAQLRRACNVHTLNYLSIEYNSFVAAEFPARVSKENMNALIDEAKKNS